MLALDRMLEKMFIKALNMGGGDMDEQTKDPSIL